MGSKTLLGFIFASWIALCLIFANLTAIENGEICEKDKETDKYECTKYGALPFIFVKIIKTFDHHEGTVVGLATIALAFFTWRLYWSTDNLVRGAEETARRELRAYVAIPADGLRPALHNQAGTTPRMRIWNFGRTAAYNTSIRAATAKNIASIDARRRTFILRGHLLSPDNHAAISFAPEIPAVPTMFEDSFCVHGEIDYTDIFKDRWRMNFIWEWGDHGEITHNFMPHQTGNREEYLGKDTDA